MHCAQCGINIAVEDHYCFACGARKLVNYDLRDENDFIEYYFKRGFRYVSILIQIDIHHKIKMSLCTLKRRLKVLGLNKSHATAPAAVIRQIIERDIENKLRTTYNIITPRDSVMEILREADPLRSNERRSRNLKRRCYSSNGPNETWYVDGYGKLKPYGFPIQGCIDGFSRKIIWLKVCGTNNYPKIPASFYIQIVQHFKYCPSKVQTDCGTENGILAALQSALVVSIDAHRYGGSPSNQQIGNWWSRNKRLYMTWVVYHFKSLVGERKYHLGNYFHRECACYVYAIFLQQE